LLRRHCVYRETTHHWGTRHLNWLRALHFDDPCSQAVFETYLLALDQRTERLEGLDLPLVEIAGRWTLPANEIARLYAETADEPDRLLDFVCFLDAREQEGRSMIADEPAFRRSHNRPKWASP